ncbi:hypothetical protein KV112_08780 [Mycolicibacter sp. MYC123]|uniref:Acyltransferase n=1 Tax=[Mycobacterium] zoologicum TaxID=2872311 RepID=A0ABU5YLH6_9MYCO|nr:hypothetical protein [Mycolicibacter sp. MYC123]MEB3049829.1 hypothetical protein [Mycolicibacter sp. MYC123]
MDTCTVEFARLTEGLGGLQCDGNPVVTLRSPLSLQSWTMPVIELLLVLGALACLIHALRWRRTHGDNSNLVIWLSGVVCLLLIEPIAYFPQWFGLQQAMGLTFVHNAFSVQFLYDRLPLYIVAMYPAYAYLAWVLVQRTGIFRLYNPVVSATAVAFVFHCLYEVIDHVGVQFRWWVWNEDLPTSVPSLGVVPYVNLQAFSLGIPFGLALVTLLVCRRPGGGGWLLARDVAVVSVLVWPIQAVFSVPALAIDVVADSMRTGRLTGTWLLIAAAAITTAIAFAGAYRARRTDPDLVPPGVDQDYFALVCVVVYLVAAAVIWGAALPDYLAANQGRTPQGAPVGALPYSVITFLLSIALTVGAYVGTTGRPAKTRIAASA